MEFVVFFFISWLVVSIYGVIRKKLDLVESTFIFLIILILSINFSWIVINELKLITVKEKWLPYSAFLLNRSIVIPFLILIHLNFVMRMEKSLHKFIFLISSVIILDGMSLLSTFFHVTEFKKWSFWYETLYFVSLVGCALLAYKLFNKTSRGVVKNP